jgi:hypothetical protein
MQITNRSLQPYHPLSSHSYLLYPGYVMPMWCHSASAYEKSTLLYFYTPIHPTHLTPSTLVVITESPNTFSLPQTKIFFVFFLFTKTSTPEDNSEV